jgi:hypothetical protein
LAQMDFALLADAFDEIFDYNISCLDVYPPPLSCPSTPSPSVYSRHSACEAIRRRERTLLCGWKRALRCAFERRPAAAAASGSEGLAAAASGSGLVTAVGYGSAAAVGYGSAAAAGYGSAAAAGTKAAATATPTSGEELAAGRSTLELARWDAAGLARAKAGPLSCWKELIRLAQLAVECAARECDET